MIPDLETAIQRLEATHRNLVGENPEDFDVAGNAASERGLAIVAVVDLLKLEEPSTKQIARLKYVNLDGVLYLERVRLARQALRGELAAAGQHSRVVSGYQSGSANQG